MADDEDKKSPEPGMVELESPVVEEPPQPVALPPDAINMSRRWNAAQRSKEQEGQADEQFQGIWLRVADENRQAKWDLAVHGAKCALLGAIAGGLLRLLDLHKLSGKDGSR